MWLIRENSDREVTVNVLSSVGFYAEDMKKSEAATFQRRVIQGHPKAVVWVEPTKEDK